MFFKKLTMTNFLGIDTRVVEFGKMTAILGRNGSGKTSVREAIIFALTGSIYGTPQIDTAVRKWADFLSVVLEFEHEGIQHIIERRRSLDGGYSIITLDGKTDIKQDSVTAIFGTWEELVSGICVGAFMWLTPDEKFDLLNDLIKGNPQSIYIEMVGNDVAGKYPYGSMTFEQVTAKVKEIDKRITNVSTERMQISARINELSWTPKPQSTVDMASIEVAKAELAGHEQTRPVYQASDKTNAEKIFQLDQDIAALNHQRSLLKKPDTTNLISLKSKYDMLEAQKKAVLEAWVCQTCKRPFEEHNKAQEAEILQNDMNAILDTGKLERAEYQSGLNAYEQGIAAIDRDIQLKQQEKLSLQKATELANSSGVTEFNITMERWNNRKTELSNKVFELETNYRNEQAAIASWNNNEDRIQDLRKQDFELTEKLKTFDLAGLEKVKEALSPKGVTFREMQTKVDEIKKFFPEGFEIELLRKNKTNDDYKKVFIVSQNGVQYQWLSKGMKMIIDAHFANLISDKKRYFTMIIDDTESLTSGILPTDSIKQVITMCAKDQDFTLSIAQ